MILPFVLLLNTSSKFIKPISLLPGIVDPIATSQNEAHMIELSPLLSYETGKKGGAGKTFNFPIHILGLVQPNVETVYYDISGISENWSY